MPSPQYVSLAVVFGSLLVSAIVPTAAGAPQDEPVARDEAAQEVVPDACEDMAKSDLDRLQGVWVRTYEENHGTGMNLFPVFEKGGLTEASDITIIQGDILYEDSGENGRLERNSRIKLDPSTSPKRVDFILLSPEQEQELKFAGIYRFEGDALTFCFTIDPDSPMRPTHFVAKEGLPIALIKYKRINKIPSYKNDGQNAVHTDTGRSAPGVPTVTEEYGLRDYTYKDAISIKNLEKLNTIRDCYQTVIKNEISASERMMKKANSLRTYPKLKLGKSYRSTFSHIITEMCGEVAGLDKLSDVDFVGMYGRICAEDARRLRISLANIDMAIYDLTHQEGDDK